VASLASVKGSSDTVRTMHRLPLVAVLLVVLAGCGGGSGDNDAASSTDTGSPPVVAVELEGETLDGERLSLADFRGKPTFVNVWASW
jgi:cytochrome oxidase Cu insertion factor (SCO1/SenC/PrrC family)